MLIGVCALVAFILVVLAHWLRLRARRVRRQIAGVIRETAAEVPQGDLVEAVYDRIVPEDHDVADKLLQSYFVDESEERVAVDAVILKYPPTLPRGAKRMLNNARLLTYVARQRGVFDHDLSAEHLGRWIVMQERWPLLARQVERDPTVLDGLERAAAAGQAALEGRMRQSGLELAEVVELHTMLTEAPLLGTLAERLLHNDPAPVQVAPAVAGASAT
jgi:hypothetical protein